MQIDYNLHEVEFQKLWSTEDNKELLVHWTFALTILANSEHNNFLFHAVVLRKEKKLLVITNLLTPPLP